ncbi:midasin, partial [Morchella conica CCBAS932]
MDYTVSDAHFLSTASGLLPPDTIALLSSRTTSTQLYLSTLSRLALRPDLTAHVFSSYEPLFPDLCARWRDTTTTAAEIACAFARVLPLAPYLADVAEEFLAPGSIALGDGLEVLLALWRLLVFRRESFVGLVKMESVAPLLKHKEPAVRYLAVRVMCIFLKASDSTREKMFAQYGVGNEAEEKVIGVWEGKEMDYGFLVLMENKRLEKLAQDVQTAKLHTLSQTSERRIIPTDALSPLTADICGILTPRLRGPPSTPSKIIDTPTTRHNIHATAVSLRSSSPTLITGPAGSGKTFLVHQIAHTLNTLNTLISIHLGDQTDAKLLVGAYTTADTPGSFEWRPGVLTTAVKEGRWISPRDLIKWATRIDALFTSTGSNGEVIPDGLYDEIFMEAVDCFAGSLQTLDARHLVVRKIGDEMLIPPQRTLAIGRARLKKRRRGKRAQAQKRPFATTNHALRLLEQVGVAVRGGEPVLLVGETGTGKTTVVQQMADLLGYGLTVMNLSQQTESGDLLGGYKPVDVRTLAVPLKEVFEELFEKTFSLKRNKRFLEVLAKCWGKQQWNRVITLWGEARKIDSMDKPALQAQWTRFASDVATLERQSSQISKSFAFSFVEGSLVKAARNGDWVLLDEINLAAPDTLESIADLLKDGKDGDVRSILLSEKGDVERVKAHPDFRIFACMNPATDVGKRDLPSGLRSRFTELYVVSPDQDLGNLLAIVREYLGPLVAGDERAVADVAGLYMEAKKLSEGQRLVDGANQRPHFSMRTLTRTLSYVVEIAGVYGLRRSLYEGFCMSFLTLLDRTSEAVLLPVIEKFILGNQRNHYWMARGTQEVEEQPHYIITPFVERNMLNLVRATATRRFPVLIQGPTSSGKTSMIEYLAKRTGHKFVRINNHEHTDLQEYLGSYVSDNTGTLRFQEGILLNLAPTDVLEALNRLLDDNRELMIPETQEVVRPHKEFMLFATQNPPGLYGGRKVLSRAFRNRFLELHFDDIPEEELETILRERCGIAPSYCAKIVKVYKELSVLRQSTRLFEQKNSFATLRDLFRWANREAVGYQQLADNGYMLLAERVRKEDEKLAVKKILEEVMRVKIDEATLYSPESTPEYQLVMKLESDVTGDIIGAQRPIRNRTAYTAQLVEDLLAWSDGSLIQAMKEGQFFLLDEISLADDSVLERLNSVLEPQRGILLAEKGPEGSAVTAVDGFQFLATMNPGGDYGKKELSPALRNRFTEIWVPSMSDYDDVLQIVRAKLSPFALQHAEVIVKFAQWFSETYHFASSTISIRDVLAWARFINMCDPHNAAFGLLHGAALVFIDGLGANPSTVLMSTAAEDLAKEKRKCILKLSELCSHDLASIYDQPFSMALDDATLRLGGFSLPRKIDSVADVSFNLEAPTTGVNAMRVVRAMQLRKPILLEGSPGVGKTSLVSALAAACGNPLTRINLSEQTDLMDLFGSDVPVEGGQSGEFAWRDAPFLQAMQRGHWVLLDEMNLASQSVLEGLNACLDHRGEAYISELDRTFKCHPEFCVFAAQNPHHQGGGRKGLPASFVNRFTVVYVDTLNLEDLQLIATRLYPGIPQDDVVKVITFVVLLDREVSQKRSFGSLGGPWEFNLRDTLRWLGLLSTTEGLLAFQDPSEFVDIVIKQRFRTVEDRARVDELFSQVFGFAPAKRHLYHQLSKDHFQVGHALLPRNSRAQPVPTQKTTLLKRNLRSLETIMTAIQQRTPIILVGPSGAGKSSIIKLLASVAGAELDEIALNSDIDTTDIVGGFEQVDISRTSTARFEWVDGMLIHAIEQGKWLVLDNANLCSPSVLDRLNSLLELNGYLVVNEHSDKNGEPKIVRPHANFRLFLTMDPRHGELSRAMRNRGIEVYIDAGVMEPMPLAAQEDDVRRVEEARWMADATTTEACIAVYSDVDRLAATSTTTDIGSSDAADAVYDELLRVVFDHLPRDQMSILKRWKTHIAADKVGPVVDVVSNVEDLSAHPRLAVLRAEFLRTVAEELSLGQSFVDAQVSGRAVFSSPSSSLLLSFDLPLNPIRNTSLLSTGIRKNNASSSSAITTLSAIHDLAREILHIKRTEADILQRSTTTRMKEMTFLEKSASKSKASSAISSAQSASSGVVGLPLFAFLTTVRRSLEAWLTEVTIETDTVHSPLPLLPSHLSPFLLPNTLTRITELLSLWRDMVALSSTHNLNESIFHVYLSLLESWIHTSSPTLPPAILTATERALGGFRAPLRLTTGFAMEALWGALRPSVPASVGAWEAYNRLREIADRFDAIVGKLQGSFETVAGLKSSLMEALTAVLTSEVEVGELVEGLEGAIVGLEERAGRSGVAVRESLLRMVFDYLLKFKALGGEKSVGVREALDYGLKLTTDYGLGTAYKQVLEDIYEYDFTSTGPQGLLQGRFALEMLRTGQAANNSFIGQLSKLNIELGALSKQFTQLTQQVTSDQLLQLNMLLLSNTKKIFELHSRTYNEDNFTVLISALEKLELALNGDSNSFEGLDLATATLDVAFKSVIDDHLIHVLNCLSTIPQTSSYSEALELSGKAWTHYALGCLKLYVPNVAFDPAMKRLVQRERYLKRKTELHNKTAAEKIFELRFTGQQDNAQIQMLEKRLADLGEEPPNSVVVRPAESEMTQLQGDMINLLQVVVNTSPHERLLPSILERRANYRDEESLFQKNLSQIIERLRRGYPLYKDLVDPILGFLYSLKMGLSLSAMEADDSSLAITLIEPSIPEVFNQQVLDDREDIKLLRLWQIAAHQNIEGYENTKQTSNKTVHSILQGFFEAWKVKTQKEQEEAAANASLYRYTGEEENADETELAAMFPAYEDEEEKEKEKEKPAGSQHRELACQIALCHSAIHLSTGLESTTLSSLIQRGVSALVKSIGEESSFCISPGKTEAFLPAIILSLKETSQWINGVTSQTYDFYTEENLEQARKLVVIVEKAHARLSVLAEAWPEHVTIQDAIAVCQEILDLPNSTPIAQSLVKVEKLHEHLNEWQGVASSEFSAAEHFDAVTQLIISWRRIELSAWPRLFDIEDEKCRAEANSWWFYVYESAIANPLQLLSEGPNLKEHVEQLLTTLVAFVETSSIAQFPHRLQLLKAFEQHALRLSDEFPAMNLVQKGLHNLIAYFSQYASEAKEATAKSRKKYQKSMSDVVLLASWKDTNILALRDSAKRSHKKLFRVVKGYRQAINQPMAPIILAGMPEGSAENSSTNGALPEPTNEMSIDFELIKGIYENSVKKWTERPARLQDLPAAVQMMKRVAKIPEDRAETINFIEDFSSSIISTMKQLQSETPGTLNDETKDIAKHLKTRKRKAFADALKELKKMGLKSNLSAALLGKQATLERILAIADPLENSQTGVQGHSENHYFLRIAEILPKIRKAVVEHSPDLTSAEVARSVGFIENLLSLSLDQRSSISSSLKELELAQSSMARYNTLSNLEIDSASLYGNKDLQSYADLQRRFQWVPKILDLAAELLKIHSEFSGKTFETANELISSSQKSATGVNDRFSAQKQLLIHSGIWEDSAKRLLEEAQSTLSLIEGSMKTIGNDYPEIAYTTTQVLPWVSLTASEFQPQTNGAVSEPATLQALDASLKTLSDSIFVALQQLKEAQATYPPSIEEPGWLLQHQSASSASLKALHTSAITRRIDDVIALTSRLQQSDLSNSQAVRALFAAYQPIIQEYTEISCRTVREALSQYRSICKTTYILSTSASTLISKGFCMPQEKGDPEGGNTDNVEGGTGLGEGEGQDDISKDIKADEDLSELAQEKDKEKRDEEIEDEKDAGSGDEKEDDDMDEETGDVDDLDPDAVDEKLWDGEADDDARDKEGDGMKDQQKQGEDMEAKKENGKEKQGEEMESKEDEDGEESEGEGADQEDDVRQQDDNEKTDAHVPEVDTLDLPEDMELDGDEKSGGEEEEDDMKMDDLSDVDDEGEEVKQDDKGDKQDSFPDLDDPEKQGEEGEPETENQEEGQENEGEENGEGEKNDEEPEEENKEEGADEPEPDSLLTTRDEQDAKEGEDTAPSDLQGVEGGNDDQDANEQTSAQRESGEDAKSGENGKGADEAQAQEETTGQASAQESERPDEKSNKKDEQTEAESSFRKVGDMLEKWHQQRRQILNAKEEDEERPQVENMEIDAPEFEHLPNDDTKADTQALGAATEEQAHSLDESMAIDSGAQEAQDAFEDMEPEAAEDPDAKDGEDNEALPEAQQPASDEPETQAGAMIGETREQRAQRQQKTEETMDLDEVEETPETAHVIDINQESALTEFGSTRSREEARQLWQQYEQSTKDLSMGLCEQLRLILEPTLATKMRGDFRTGKRLNMKRIIPYIASQYKKDKIWMRRTKPSKRQYQVMIAVDDSKSMAESESVALAFETVALVAKALSQLEVGQISIVSFGETTRLIHPFDQPFTSEAGVKVFERFQFDQLKTNVRTLLDTSMGIFETAKVNSSADLWQLEIIISDGVCEDHETLKRLVRRAQEEKIMIVFVILDSVRDKSILHMKQVRFETGADGTQELKMERYLDTFPFGFYLVVNDIRELPGVLALALRQWFAEVADA